MQNYQGKYGQAKVFIDLIDEEDKDKATIQQIYEFLNHEAFTNPIAIMPDCHKGNGAVIGFTMELSNKVIPNVIGVDIGCGVLSVNLGNKFLDNLSREDLNNIIRTKVPFGTSVHPDTLPLNKNILKEINTLLNLLSYNYHKSFVPWGEKKFKAPIVTNKWLEKKCEQIGMDYGRMLNSLGTLGGGNHFIELGIDIDENYWMTFHSGSRQFGLKIANYHQKLANSFHPTGKDRRGLAYLQGKEMFDYLVDMVVAQYYAEVNRKFMMNQVLLYTPDFEIKNSIQSVHNFIDFNDFIIRKGAIRSYENEFMVIPFNMEDGLIICEGKSNSEWNFSAPHGAGRVASRRWAKDNLSLDEAIQSMEDKDIYTSKIPHDEIKGAYKSSEMIKNNIKDTANILHFIKPVLNCKE